MPFDPSVIASIGDSAPDPVAAQGKALTLADLYDQNKIRKSEMATKAQEQSDMTYAKGVLSKADLSNPESQNAAVAEITKRSPALGMKLMKDFQGQQAGKNELDRTQLELYNAKNDIVGGALVGLKTKHDQLLQANPQITDQQLHDAMQGDVLQAVQSLSRATLPNGKPVLDDNDKRTIQQTFGSGYGLQAAPAVDALVMRSKQAKDVLSQQLAQRKEANVEAGTAERITHDRAMEANAGRRTDISERTARFREEKATQARAMFQGENGELMAALAERGISLPTGFRGKEEKAAMLTALYKRNPGLDADAIADKVEKGQLDLGALKKEVQVAGTQVGKVKLAENEIFEFGPQVLEASAGLPRGTTLTGNALMQMGEGQLSDPKLLRLRTKLQALNSAYDQLTARGGTDKDKRAHVHELFNSRLSEAGIKELVRSITEEAEGAKRAAQKTMEVDLPTRSTGAPAAGAAAPPQRPGQGASDGTPKVMNWADLPH